MSDETEPWVNIVAVNLVRAYAGALTPAETLVLYCLAFHADADGVAYPSLTTISNETHVSRVWVQKALTSLAEKQLILRDRYRPAEGKRRGHSGYKLRGEWVTELPNRMQRIGNSELRIGNSVTPNKQEDKGSIGDERNGRQKVPLRRQRNGTNGRSPGQPDYVSDPRFDKLEWTDAWYPVASSNEFQHALWWRTIGRERNK